MIVSLLGIVRELYVGRGSGVVDVGDTTLWFRDGHLHVGRDSPAAAELRVAMSSDQAARDDETGDSTIRDSAQKLALETLASELAGRHCRRRATGADSEGAVGPLPGGWFLMALAVHGCGPRELRGRLGTETTHVRAVLEGPALEELRGLPPRMASLLGRLGRESPIDGLVRDAGTEGAAMLRDLVALHAVGLVVTETPAVEAASADRKALDRFREAVGNQLVLEPVTLDVEEHRTRLATLWRTLGESDHYRLLGLAPGAPPEAVQASFTDLAKLVHPSQAPRLGLAADDAMLEVVFERAVEAYRTLADPERRMAYHRQTGLSISQEIDLRQRDEEKRAMAHELYRRGVSLLAANEISPAVDALREAVRLDPQADYLAALGRGQSRNRGWYRHAHESFHRAIAKAPGDAGLYVSLGAVCEKMERVDEAIEAYRKAVSLMPDNAEAKKSLERLGVSLRASGTFGVKGLFGRRSESGASGR